MSGVSQLRLSFIDTNVWLCAFIPSQDANKSANAKAIIQQSDVIISPQVINEICVNLIKKTQFDESSIQQLIASFYNKYRVADLDKNVLMKASELRERWHFSFWDSLVVSSALLGGAEILYSEDLHNGLVVENRLTVIINPFVP